MPGSAGLLRGSGSGLRAQGSGLRASGLGLRAEEARHKKSPFVEVFQAGKAQIR